MAAWNAYACGRLESCMILLDAFAQGGESVDPDNSYAFIGRKAMGSLGGWVWGGGGGGGVWLCVDASCVEGGCIPVVACLPLPP
jgi:hypothetical protein